MTGKSKLLVAMLHLMAHHMRSKSVEPGQPRRVLLAAHTNIAVDRVLLGLLDTGCTGGRKNPPELSRPCNIPQGALHLSRLLPSCSSWLWQRLLC